MDLGTMLDVGIGIIFVWIVISLTTIQIQEWVSTQFDKRAKDMEASIHEMLANPNLKAQFYDHPVIRGLTAKKRKEPSEAPPWYYRWPIVRGFTREKRKLPSYIPSQQFALAMFDIAMTAGTESSVIQQGILQVRDELRDAKKLRKDWKLHQAVIEELNLLAEFARSAAATEAGTAITLRTRELLKQQAKNFLTNFKDKHKDLKLDKELEEKLRKGITAALQEASARKKEIDKVIRQQAPVNSATNLSKVRDGIAALSVISPEVNQTLNALLLNVEDYVTDKEQVLAKARGSVEKWFNDAMDRASGAYKRYSQNLALVIGIIVALLLNVDSIDLTLYLWREPAVRTALANQASTFELPQGKFQTNPQEAMQEFRDQFVGLNLPVGWGINEITDGRAYGNDSCRMFPEKKEDQVFGIPVPGSNKCIVPSQSNEQGNLAVKLFGILITAVAARQGAPFWFDMLKRVVNVRSTGANPAEKEAK